uniref:Ig-like domain-containing protein n=1 Tax=Sphenodon punctatus TaxID=8508 RepID=A0A8D0HBY1_SPHPU
MLWFREMGRSGGHVPCCLLICWWAGMSAAQEGLHFLESPSNLTSSLGKDVKLRCSVQAHGEPPEISWLRDGAALELADSNQVQVPEEEEAWLVISELSIPSVQLMDTGSYQCAVLVNGTEILSGEAYLELEGESCF